MEIEFDMVDIDLDSSGNPLPEKNNLVALIDADTLIFSACLHCEEQEDLLPRDYYSDSEWEEITSDPNYFESDHCIYRINLDEAYEYALEKLNSLLEKTGCKDYELHFTTGRKSFRYTKVYNMYKANRLEDSQGNKTRKPTGLTELKYKFAEDGKGFVWTEWEADDIVVAKKYKWPDKYLLVALDKDVLYSLPGRHFNYYSSAQYNIDMKFFEVTKEQAIKHHYRQCLTGDKGDNVPGLHRVGPKTADKILNSCTNQAECWKAVVSEYESRGKTVIDAIQTMRLVSMHQLMYIDGKWKVELWKPVS
jgi:DNA polymerase-1